MAVQTYTKSRVMGLVKNQKSKLDAMKEYVATFNGNVTPEDRMEIKLRMEFFTELCKQFEIGSDEISATAQ